MRFRDRAFFVAAMAAAALVATADGQVSAQERQQLETVLQTNDALRVFQSWDAASTFRRFLDAMDQQADGREAAFQAVGALGENPAGASALIRLALLIAQADGGINDAERQVLSELCDELGIEADAVLA